MQKDDRVSSQHRLTMRKLLLLFFVLPSFCFAQDLADSLHTHLNFGAGYNYGFALDFNDAAGKNYKGGSGYGGGIDVAGRWGKHVYGGIGLARYEHNLYNTGTDSSLYATTGLLGYSQDHYRISYFFIPLYLEFPFAKGPWLFSGKIGMGRMIAPRAIEYSEMPGGDISTFEAKGNSFKGRRLTLSASAGRQLSSKLHAWVEVSYQNHYMLFDNTPATPQAYTNYAFSFKSIGVAAKLSVSLKQ